MRNEQKGERARFVAMRSVVGESVLGSGPYLYNLVVVDSVLGLREGKTIFVVYFTGSFNKIVTQTQTSFV